MIRSGWCVLTVRFARFLPSTIHEVPVVFCLLLMLTVVLRVCAVCPAAMAQTTASSPAFPPDSATTASFSVATIGPKYASERVILRFRAGVRIMAEAVAHSKVGTTLLRRFHAVPGLQLVRLPVGSSIEEVLHWYRSDPNIIYAEPDTLLHVLETVPNDPSFSSLWALKNTGQSGGTIDADIDASNAWTLSTGSNGVYIGVIDSGVDYSHPDLSGNIYSSPTDCNLNGIDDDADGYVDDCHGIDTVNHDSDPMDDSDHGSHVSGIIGAMGNNAIGIVGVNWRVTIVPCKFLDSSGSGPLSAAIECLDWFATLKDHGLNIIATNNSWGGSVSSQALADAIKANMQRGILFVAAAGNGGTDGIGDNNDTVPAFPADCGLPNVIAVGATDHNDLLGDFSNFGQHTVHLGAPGVNILSTIRGNSYTTFSGTSMATPHVAGAVALLKAWSPSLDWRPIKNLLLSSVEPIAALSGKTITGGRLNVYSAMSCSNAPLFSPLLPYGNPTVVVGSTISFAALNVVCAQPAGNVRVTIDSAETVILRDDGTNGDALPDDGIYTGQWIAATAGWHTYTFQEGSSGTIGVLAPYGSPISTTYSYRPITGTNLQLSDDGVTSLNLNAAGLFPVTIGGLTFNAISIGANGVLSLDNFNEYTNGPIPDSSARVLIAPWWDDLAPQRGTDQNVFFQVTGAAPNRELVIEWRNMPHYEATTNVTKAVTFEAVFPESSPSSDIFFNYADANFDETDQSTYNAGGSATVGVQVDSTHGAQYSYNQPILTNGLALLFQAVSGPLPSPSLAVVSPNGGESWSMGSTQTIRWNYAGSVGSTVMIELLKASVLRSTISASTALGSGGTGSFSWKIDPGLAAASDYQIRVASTTNSAIVDISDATFSINPVANYTLSVTKAGAGSGTVTGADINCGTDCGGTYAQGTQVTLTAIASADSAFAGWGGACSGTGDCSVVMDAAKSVSATFDPLPSFDFGVPPLSATVVAGQTAEFAIVLTGQPGFAGSVSLSCSAGVPPAAACSFNPALVNPGSGMATSTLRVSTTARATAHYHVSVNITFTSLVLALAFLGTGARRRLAILAASLILAAAILACGGGGAQVNPLPTTGTPPGAYAITISATSGSTTRTETVTLLVN